MFALKSIKASLISRKHHTLFPPSKLPNSKNSILCLCKTNDPNDSDPESPSPEGDTRQQELLATIAMLQTQKVRLTEYLDERAAYLTQYAEEANSEFDKVGEDAFREIQEAGDTIMETIESKMQAFRESQELNRVEIEKNENKLEWFEDQIEENRNEGLFFKNQGARKSLDRAEAREEMEEIKEVIKETAGSKNRRNIYLALMALLVVEIADSFISSPDWRKVAVLGAILVALFTQFVNEQEMISEAEKLEKERSDQKK
ncbi:hypothetical protein SLE2022_104940 [Rubroshorea leprosula]